MSMLAEPRRKNRMGPNPRGKFFSEDEDNRGRNMLQKMGWKNGDGLGVERQGITEPIKPKIQTDAKGLGFDIKSDPWLAHSDDFNAILKNLQATHGTLQSESVQVKEESSSTVGFGFHSEATKSKASEKSHVDLEAKSRTSKSRIHYQKFIKNKDLSKIKGKDWSCIFGKPVDSTGNPIETLPEVEVKVEKVAETSNAFTSGNFINRGSYQDYFKLQREKAFVKSTLLEDQRKPQDGEVYDSNVPIYSTEDDITTVSEEIKKSKKDKKTKKEQELPILDYIEDRPVKEKKRKKDKKIREQEVIDAELSPSTASTLELNEEIEDPPKRKKRKKDKKAKIEFNEEIDEGGPLVRNPTAQEEDNTTKKKHKKDKKAKKEKSLAAEMIGDEVETSVSKSTEEVEDKPPKDKKHKKNKKAKTEPQDEINVDSSILEPTPTVVEKSPADEITLKKNQETSAKIRHNATGKEILAAADAFKGSNLLLIPGYRIQSNKLL